MVYNIIASHLFFALIISCCALSQDTYKTFKENFALFWVCLGLMIAILIFVIVLPKYAKDPTYANILQISYGLIQALGIATLSVAFNYKIFICALTLCLLVGAALYIFSLIYVRNYLEFSLLGGLIVSTNVVLCGLGLNCIFLPFLNSLYNAVGVFLFSLYLLGDSFFILMMVGPEYHLTDYCYVSLNFYIDYINWIVYFVKSPKKENK